MKLTENEEIICPFCGEKGFDLKGLKIHLTGYGLLFAGPCPEYEKISLAEKEANHDNGK